MTRLSVFSRARLAAALTIAALLTACGSEEPPAPIEVRAPIQAISQIPLQDMVACAQDAAPLVDNTGTFSRSINTGMELAQAYFDQGLRLAYGYYFPEAIASFNAALCLDPQNAMIHWGRALAMGPNPNSRYAGVPDDPAGAGKAAVDRAMALADTLPPAERGLVETLAVLFDTEAYPDVMARTNAFVDAAEANYQAHSADLEAAFLVPHAIMMTTPWHYYAAQDGSPLAGVSRAREVIERGIAQNPRHPGLTHLHIHLLEASFEPEAAEASADRLESLTPMIGHMVHMPGHIYMRLGRYNDSITTNQRSLQADEFLQQAWGNRDLPRNGTYFLSATNHGGHARMFIHWAGLLQGNFERAVSVSAPMATMADVEALNRGSGLRSQVAHWMTLKAFGRYDDLLALQNPAPEQPYLAGMLHWVHGSAHAANGDLASAQEALTALQSIIQSAAGLDTMRASVNTAEDLLAIAAHMLAGEIANAQEDYAAAVTHFEQAVALQDALRYMEPPDWIQSTRLFLGQALINAGQPEEAVSVFERDLLLLNENGWALQGLAQALAAVGRNEDAAVARQRQADAWADADVELTAAHF